MIGALRFVWQLKLKALKWAVLLVVALVVLIAVTAKIHDAGVNVDGFLHTVEIAALGFLVWKGWRVWSWIRERRREIPQPIEARRIDGKLVPDKPAVAALAVPRLSPDPQYILRGLPDYGKVLLGLHGDEFAYAGEPAEPIPEPLAAPPPAPSFWQRLVSWFAGAFRKSDAKEAGALATGWSKWVAVAAAAAIVGGFIYMNLPLVTKYHVAQYFSPDEESVSDDMLPQLILAEKGDTAAQFVIGVAYEMGIGAKQNNIRALDWLSKAATQGNENAQKELEKVIRNEQAATASVPEEHQHAQPEPISTPQAVAAAASNEPQNVEPQPVSKVKVKSAYTSKAKEIERSAEKYLYGIMLVKQDKAEAERLFNEAAELYRLGAKEGDAEARQRLAEMAKQGRGGVTQTEVASFPSAS